MGYLYDGSEKSQKDIPPLSIFLENNYKKHTMPALKPDRIKNIIRYNGFGGLQLKEAYA